MKIGCHLPMFGPIGTRHAVLTFARRMEALGYDSLWASDHVVIPHRITTPYPYSPAGKFPLAPEVPFLEPLTTLALVAGVTERVQLGTSILVLPHRNPVLAAKMTATIDHLSEGRLVLGVGVGWMREEIELLGGNFDRRGAWSDEALTVMRACWRDARAAHHGEFFSFDEIGVFPKPTPGDIPILIGGHTPLASSSWATAGTPPSSRPTRSRPTSRGFGRNAPASIARSTGSRSACARACRCATPRSARTGSPCRAPATRCSPTSPPSATSASSPCSSRPATEASTT
jgi:probable F420-dependent oxidoreductase